MSKPLSYLELSREKLRHNAHAFRNFIHPSTKLGAVVKANAYGHGQAEVTAILEDMVDYFLVDDIEELRRLRESSTKPALVLGYIAKADLEKAVQLKGELALYDTERLMLLQELAVQKNLQAVIHLKIDAFLGRQGILLEDVAAFATQLQRCPQVTLAAAYSHFANIEDTSDFSHAEKQLATLNQAVQLLRNNGFPGISSHISATSGVMLYEKNSPTHSLVRVGIGLYGLYPSSSILAKNEELQLQPILRWVSHLAQVKTVPAQFPIGYGLTYITSKETKIAIVPQGYSDGYDRGLSNVGEVLVQGTRCPVLGRIAMNMFAIDVSHLPNVQAEEEVILLGNQGTESISAEELAEKIGSINYEITARLSPLLPRIVA